MASNGSLKFVPNERHFSAIIRGGDSIDLSKLVIPERYVTLYGDDLPSRVTLKVPSGAEWKVQIVRSNNGEISFQKGWPEFANYYSLVEGSSLVFKYENNIASGSNDDQYFNVIIFDKNRIEIDYPFSFNVNGDDSERVSVDQEPEQVPEQPTDVDESDSDSSDCIEFIFGSTKQNEQKVKEEKDNSEGTKRRKANEASSSRATPNPTFTVEMNASKFLNRNKYHLSLPVRFVKNILEPGNHQVKLQLQNKLWTVNLNIGFLRGKWYPSFYKGWFEFAKQNSLEVGDKCSFELIDTQMLLIRVSIERDIVSIL